MNLAVAHGEIAPSQCLGDVLDAGIGSLGQFCEIFLGLCRQSEHGQVSGSLQFPELWADQHLISVAVRGTVVEPTTAPPETFAQLG